MKSIMISIKPEWVAKILNGEKTIEIRKTIPKCELPCKVYIYETKGKILIGKHFERSKSKENLYFGGKAKYIIKKDYYFGKGKIVAEFMLDKYDLLVDYGSGIKYVDKDLNYLDVDFLRTNSCLTDEQIYLYLGLMKNKGYYNDGYVWYINELKIYDTPKELRDFSAFIPNNKCEENCQRCDCYDKEHETCLACYNLKKPLKRPPQSWCYIEGESKW